MIKPKLLGPYIFILVLKSYRSETFFIISYIETLKGDFLYHDLQLGHHQTEGYTHWQTHLQVPFFYY